MNPLIAALLAAGVISDEEARTLNGLLNEGATRIEAEQRIAAAFANGFENQRSRLIRALDMGNVDYRDPMLPTFWAAEHDLLAREVLPTLTGIAQDVALTATVRSGGLADWRTVNEAVIQWTDTHYRSVAGDALGSIPNLDNTARDAVADAVNRWQRGELNAGPGPMGLPRLIAELQNVEEFGVDRAARIAVTETTRIFAESERTAALANPNMEYLVWQTSSDEATCLICAPMEGQRIPKGQSTFPGGYYPPAHPNCRCGVTAVTEFAAEVMSGAVVPGPVRINPGTQDFTPQGEVISTWFDNDKLIAESQAWKDSLTEGELHALNQYTGEKYKEIARNIEIDNIGDIERNLLAAVERAPRVDGLVYRGINPSSGFGGSAQAYRDKYTQGIGTVIEWDKVSSVSVDSITAKGFGNTVFEVKSKNARYIDVAAKRFGARDSDYDEFEALFLPHTRFRIVNSYSGMIEDLDGPEKRWIIQLEEVDE